MKRNVEANDKIRGIKIPTEITEDLAYLCGIFAGDGSIGYRKQKNEYCLKVVGNPKDEKEFYHQVIGPKFQETFGIFPRMKFHDSKTTYGFSVYSKTIYLYLTESIGLPSGVKYPSLQIPKLFLKNEKLTISFIRGVFDTDGCMCFKKGSRAYPYYPVISVASKSAHFIEEIANILKKFNFSLNVRLNIIRSDVRILSGYTIISSIEISGFKNFEFWMDKIGFYSPKHLAKIEKHKQNL